MKDSAEPTQGDTSMSSNSSKSLRVTTPVAAPSPHGLVPLSNEDTTPQALKMPSNAVAAPPSVPEIAPTGLMQGMFHHASNTRIGNAVFNICMFFTPLLHEYR